jgi:hypothetical protein
MTIGQLITSFLQGKVSQTTTSTIFSPYVDHVMEESKTAYFSGSHGATLDTNRGRTKTVGGRMIRGANDLLPYGVRPIKAKRRKSRGGYTLLVELYTFRLVWRSHHLPRIKRKLRELQSKRKVWWKA